MEEITLTQAASASTHYVSESTTTSKMIWTGRVVSGLAVLFLLFDILMKFIQPPEAIEGTQQLGYATSAIFTLGVIQLVCLILYLIPATAFFGAILWTGYLGGAVATHFRIDNPLISHTLFPIYVALFLWGGLWLRDARLRKLLPLRRG
jgi:hypothetical protein